MATRSSTRKRGAVPRTPAVASAPASLATRLQGIADTWDSIDDGKRLDTVGLELDDKQLRFIAEKLDIPFLGAQLLNRVLTCADLREREAWPHRKLLLNLCEIVEGDEVQS